MVLVLSSFKLIFYYSNKYYGSVCIIAVRMFSLHRTVDGYLLSIYTCNYDN